jgi:hypothetical protein
MQPASGDDLRKGSLPMAQQNRFDNGKTFLEALGLNEVHHSRETFLDHLVSTGGILKEWGCPEPVYLAGLFHAIYGTETFPLQDARGVTREAVRNVIGPEAEQLAWLFGISTAKSLWSQLSSLGGASSSQSTYSLIHRVTGEDMPCDNSDMLALANIILANVLDQAYRLPERYDSIKLSRFQFLVSHLPPRGATAFNELLCQRSLRSQTRPASSDL